MFHKDWDSYIKPVHAQVFWSVMLHNVLTAKFVSFIEQQTEFLDKRQASKGRECTIIYNKNYTLYIYIYLHS